MTRRKEGTILQAVEKLLTEVGRPMHYRQITEEILNREYWKTTGLTPEATVNAVIIRDDLEPYGENSTFKRTAPGTYGLRQWRQYPEYGSKVANGAFQLVELELRNFRCFEERKLRFSREFTILIGDNGLGKTAVLDALAIGVGAFLSSLKALDVPTIRTDDVRLRTYEKNGSLISEPQYPVTVTCTAEFESQPMSWERRKSGEKPNVRNHGMEDLKEIGQLLQKQVRDGKDAILPLIAYYGTGRLWRSSAKASGETSRLSSRLDGYMSCLNSISNVGALMQLIRKQEMISLQEKTKVLTLEAVKHAISECLNEINDVSYIIREEDLIATFTDGRRLPFRMLSDGVRNMLAMVADIAQRAASLNPHFGEQAVKNTPGVVFIDEIDLHLHPKWQRRIVDDLRRTFPKIQFIATTHSPFIIQSLRPGELVDLGEPSQIPAGEYANKSIEDITENILDIPVPQRSERYQDMFEAAKTYYRLLEEGQTANQARIAKIKQELDELIAPFSDDVAYHAFLELKLEASGL